MSYQSSANIFHLLHLPVETQASILQELLVTESGTLQIVKENGIFKCHPSGTLYPAILRTNSNLLNLGLSILYPSHYFHISGRHLAEFSTLIGRESFAAIRNFRIDISNNRVSTSAEIADIENNLDAFAALDSLEIAIMRKTATGPGARRLNQLREKESVIQMELIEEKFKQVLEAKDKKFRRGSWLEIYPARHVLMSIKFNIQHGRTQALHAGSLPTMNDFLE